LAEKYNTELPVTVLPTMVDLRPRFTREMLRELRDLFPDSMSQTCIHYTVRLKEAVREGCAIFDHDAQNIAALDYDRLARELMGEKVGQVTVTAFKSGRPARSGESARPGRPAGSDVTRAAADPPKPSGPDQDAPAAFVGSAGQRYAAVALEEDLPADWRIEESAPESKGLGDDDAVRDAERIAAVDAAIIAAAKDAAPRAKAKTQAASKPAAKGKDKGKAGAPAEEAADRALEAAPSKSTAFAPRAEVEAASRAAGRLGDQPTLSEVVLDVSGVPGRRVQVAGDFNDWIPDRGISTQDVAGTVKKVMKLKPGVYQYRVIVDGIWQEDPGNPERVPNIYGGNNSLLNVGPEPAAPAE